MRQSWRGIGGHFGPWVHSDSPTFRQRRAKKTNQVAFKFACRRSVNPRAPCCLGRVANCRPNIHACTTTTGRSSGSDCVPCSAVARNPRRVSRRRTREPSSSADNILRTSTSRRCRWWLPRLLDQRFAIVWPCKQSPSDRPTWPTTIHHPSSSLTLHAASSRRVA